ncbi:MAG: copper resistance protein NlpE [Rickettsiales bacterium]|jgi:uncharacterized lipoprotein NlpE involved in copper resistance|nr:copper resistance protein NlpE [Rickettsiales bacterium]
MNKKVKMILNIIIVILAIFLLFLIFKKDKSPLPYGTFTGVFPCADCAGIKTTLTLNKDFTYFLDQQYMSKDDTVYTQVGKWSITEDLKLIELGYDRDSGIYYRVLNDDELEKLDEEGREIRSQFSYKLRKI